MAVDLAHSAPVADADMRLTAEMLIPIWQRLLGASLVTPEDDFFDLGGDSLLALQLALEVERLAGRKLPATIVYECPTIAALVSYCAPDASERSDGALMLKDGNAALPAVLLIPGLDGMVSQVSRLARSMAYEGQIFGLEARGVDGQSNPLESVEELARYHYDAVRRRRPAGPYIIIGYSFGGVVALELAHDFREAGEAISLLAVIDGYPSRRCWPPGARFGIEMRKLWRDLKSILRLLASLVVGGRGGGLSRSMARVRGHAGQRTDIGFYPDPELPEAIQKVFFASDRALSKYRPRRFPGPILFYSSQRPGILPRYPGPVWSPLGEELLTDSVTGDHLSIFEAGLPELAAKLSLRLAEAVRKSSQH